jgi:hypothetical protein
MLLFSKDSKCLRAEIKRRKHADEHERPHQPPSAGSKDQHNQNAPDYREGKFFDQVSTKLHRYPALCRCGTNFRIDGWNYRWEATFSHLPT